MRIIDTAQLRPDNTLEGANQPLTQNEIDAIYNGLDCCVTLEIKQELLPLLDDVTRLVYERSLALQAPILEMSQRGILIDETARQTVLAKYKAQIELLDKRLTRIINEGIGLATPEGKTTRGKTTRWWRSPKNLKTLFYQVLGVPVQRKRNTQGVWAPTLDREALEKLSTYYYAEPICNYLLTLRDIDKKRGFLETELDADQRIRASFNIAGTNTGRLASSMSDYGTGTNLQNVDRDLRSVFVADPGYKLGNLDLEQADARNLGALIWNIFYDSHGPEYAGKFLDACESGDLHTIVTQMVWPDLPWTDDPKHNKNVVAAQLFYRQDSYRQMSKKLGHGCLTADHEVLTPQGWVPISTKPKLIMAWNPITEKMQWESPSHWEDKPWFDDLYQITGYNTNMLVTSDHRMPVFTKRGIFKEQPAEQLKSFPELNLKQHGLFVGGTAPITPNQARLTAAAQADGHIYPNGSVRWGFSKNRKKERLEVLLAHRKVKVTEYKKRDETYYHLPKEEVDFPAIKQAGPWMLNWPIEALTAFVDELKYWDGTIQPTYTWIYGKDRTHIEWLRTICLLVGQGASYRTNDGHDCASVGINRRLNRRIGSLKIEQKPGLGRRVYCPTVPSSGFLVRRNGDVMFSLNTNYYGTPRTMAKHTKVDTSIIELFQRRYFKAFPAIGNADHSDGDNFHTWVRKQLRESHSITTLFGRRRYFFGRAEEDTTLREAIAYPNQSGTAEEINIGMLNLWRPNRIQLLCQVHDSLLFQYKEEEEDEIIPWALNAMRAPIMLAGGREFCVPVEAKVGWNWGEVEGASHDNPDGLIKWRGHDERRRTHTPTTRGRRSILDL